MKLSENNCFQLNGLARRSLALLNLAVSVCFDRYDFDYTLQVPARVHREPHGEMILMIVGYCAVADRGQQASCRRVVNVLHRGRAGILIVIVVLGDHLRAGEDARWRRPARDRLGHPHSVAVVAVASASATAARRNVVSVSISIQNACRRTIAFLLQLVVNGYGVIGVIAYYQSHLITEYISKATLQT